MRRVIFRFTLFAVTLLVCLVAAEVVLRLLSLYEPPPYPPQARNPTLYRADDLVGYHLWPSASMSYRYPDDSPVLLEVNSNSDGFRNRRNFGPDRPGYRMILTGDSFVFGDGVQASERVSDQLEAMLPGFWVDNLGMTGWGVDNMLRATRWIAPKVRPDLVLVCIYTDDFPRVDPYYSGMGYRQPRFALVGDRLVSTPYPSLSLLQRMRVNQARVQLSFRHSGFIWQIHEALLNDFRRLAKELNFELALVFFPGRIDTDRDRLRRGWLVDYGARHDVPVLDLTEAIHEAGIENTYIEDNMHWNATGHQVAAREITSFVERIFPNPP